VNRHCHPRIPSDILVVTPLFSGIEKDVFAITVEPPGA
jgi:hypothetical protein